MEGGDRRPGARRSRQGFNLLEVIIAAFIFTTVSLALTSVWVRHAQVVSRSRNLILAGFLAQSVLESATKQGYNVVAVPASNPVVTSFDGVFDRKDTHVEFRYYVEVSTQPAASLIPPKLVRVVVHWDDETGRDREVKLATLLYWQG